MAAHYDIWKCNTGVRTLQDSVMSYSVALAICFCCFLCGSKAQGSTEDGGFQGINDVAGDFHILTNRTISSVGQHSGWIWKPVGNERNTIEFGPAIGIFGKDRSASGAENHEELLNATQPEKSWIVNDTTEVIAVRSLKTFDRKRNKTEENAYLIYEKHLKQTNWCFKDTEDTKLNSKFKVKLTFYLILLVLKYIICYSSQNI